MRVSKIQIKDFKRFHDLTIDLGKDPKKIIALIGPNGCGKSSVLDAFVSKVITASSSRVSKGYIPQHFWRDKDNRWNSIKVLDKDENEIIHKNNEISIRSPYRYNTSLDIKEIKAVKRIQENEDGEISTIHIDDRIENNYRLLLAQYRDYLEEKNVKPSEAKEYIMGDLNDSIKRWLPPTRRTTSPNTAAATALDFSDDLIRYRRRADRRFTAAAPCYLNHNGIDDRCDCHGNSVF